MLEREQWEKKFGTEKTTPILRGHALAHKTWQGRPTNKYWCVYTVGTPQQEFSSNHDIESLLWMNCRGKPTDNKSANFAL